jgi:class 3 adenylate cyclase
MVTELKVVMFTDQVKSTANTTRRKHAEIEQVAREQDKLTVEVLRLTRGMLLKDTGDGCLAQFPSVIEAVQAGVLLQRRVAERNAAQSIEHLQFELRVGIDVGELVVLENGDLRGNAANRCARICSECQPGKVYLSDTAAGMLKENEVGLVPVGAVSLKGIKDKTALYRVNVLHVLLQDSLNPFVWRGGITHADYFFNRENEQRVLRAYLHGRLSCQIVDPLRFGKTSLLRHIERNASSWKDDTTAVYLDMQHPRCFTLAGWLGQASKVMGWSRSISTLVDFAERIEDVLSQGTHLILCLDDFDELLLRSNEFNRDFFMTLRACARLGMSIITASQRPLSSFAVLNDPTSPFYNIFSLLMLDPFTDSDVEEFITHYRWGVAPFKPEEKGAILSFAKGHPLALQVACFHVLDAKHRGESLAVAMRRAEEEMKGLLPTGW